MQLCKRDPMTAATRHDYARIWRSLKAAERNRRIGIALERLAAGETLAQVAATWSISASALCRALLAYAPIEWRRALAARAVVRYQDAADKLAEEPRNPMARARAWATRWHLDHALRLAGLDVRVGRTGPIRGPCNDCGSGTVWVTGKSARCVSCGTESAPLDYLAPRH